MTNYRAIMLAMPHVPNHIDAFARECGQHGDTIKKTLNYKHGTSFSDLRNEVRAELLLDLEGQRPKTFCERLGFGAAKTFYKWHTAYFGYSWKQRSVKMGDESDAEEVRAQQVVVVIDTISAAVNTLVDRMTEELTEEEDEHVRTILMEQYRFWRMVPR